MKRTLALAAVVAAFSSPLQAQGTATSPKPQPSASAASPTPPPAASATPGVPDEAALYALGVSLAKDLAGLDLTPSEAQSVMKGFADALANKASGVDLAAARPKIKALAEARASVRLEKEKARGKVFREETAKAPDAVVWPSGLIYTETKAGTGDSPGASDTVKVQYRGTLVDGTEFDNSAKRPGPSSFAVNGVIRCCRREGQARLPVGDRLRRSRGSSHHPAGRDAGVRRGAVGDRQSDAGQGPED